MKILFDLRPAFAGYAGIPQETRLLFSALRRLPGVQVDGLLQSSNRLLPADRGGVAAALARGDGGGGRWPGLLWGTGLAAVAAWRGQPLPLPAFDAEAHREALWQALFAKTLANRDREAVTAGTFRVARLPWSAAHAGGLLVSGGQRRYPVLDTTGYDVMVVETPYPGRVRSGTRLVVRYHDAFPLTMPHTTLRGAYHRAMHLHALHRNVEDGAWFVCVSQASLNDLVHAAPQVAPRAVVVPDMLSPASGAPGQDASGSMLPVASPYLLMVGTLEPRKNHLALLEAWETLRRTSRPGLQLVLVGASGWKNRSLLRRLRGPVADGQIRVLSSVPAEQLGRLYRQAVLTVCPSLAEGFGYAGVEAMRSGGVVAASDIEAHREVYGAAAEYFDPLSPADMARTIERLTDPSQAARREALIAAGREVCARYRLEALLPRWHTLLSALAPAGAEPVSVTLRPPQEFHTDFP